MTETEAVTAISSLTDTYHVARPPRASKAIKVLKHDYDETRAKAPRGQLPRLSYSAGSKTMLLPHGQQVGIDNDKPPAGITGKAWRKQRKKARREFRTDPIVQREKALQ